MPEPQFQDLKLELLRGGVSLHYVNRMIVELREHYADLEEDGLRGGVSPDDAAVEARAALGSERSIAAAAVRALDALLVIPMAPVAVCLDRGPLIVRWGASVSLAFLLTGGMLLTLHWLILTASR